ncbi:PREDICTED: GDSL esterase/lipase At5g55050-like [Nelumbo nucifera]|uniref:GDSL esterase/lipase At5g55050-like n=1 Tax=Nelumbo nucifera TaxID=4432 RepID=A0A1U7Z1L2_NELNU|nr:PREDICTED: GDSL esterase/lipase At5g55050-like [Nelumbo nucifera]
MASWISLLYLFIFSFIYTETQLVPAIFMFGDSLVDVGNNNHLKLSLAKADFPHNGVDFPGKKPTGRFSNGRNAADFLAEKLGLQTSPPYLSLVSATNKSNAFLGGASFASGGAGILDGTDTLFKQSISLNKQIEYYSTVYGDLVQQLGTVEAQTYFSKSLYGIVIGSNDILGYFGSGSTLRDKYTPQQYIDLMIFTLRGQLKRLYSLGARKLAVVGAGAIGCCPSQRNQNQTGECHEQANYWSLKYNQGFISLLQELKSELKDMNYSFFDTYTLLLNFIQKPAAYGFTEVKAACCGLGNLNAKVACLPISSYCPNRRDHVFWDLYHPTEAAARIFTDNIFDGSEPIVFPINVRQLAVM